MSWALVPWGLSLLLGLVGFVLVWYYRMRWLEAEKSLTIITDTRAEWAAQNQYQAEQLTKAWDELKQRQSEESKNDRKQAELAARDATVASDLLNGLGDGLHPNGDRANSSDSASVPPGADAGPALPIIETLR